MGVRVALIRFSSPLSNSHGFFFLTSPESAVRVFIYSIYAYCFVLRSVLYSIVAAATVVVAVVAVVVVVVAGTVVLCSAIRSFRATAVPCNEYGVHFKIATLTHIERQSISQCDRRIQATVLNVCVYVMSGGGEICSIVVFDIVCFTFYSLCFVLFVRGTVCRDTYIIRFKLQLFVI